MFFTLMLEVPIPTYATIDDQREELEKSIRRRVSQIIRTEIGNSISEVVISPILDESRPVGPVPSADIPPEEIPSFWQPGFFRLFITHVSTKKIEAHRLKESLAAFQIAAFVAHDDIEPTREWQAEIERALRTMDALTAFISPDFLSSRWVRSRSRHSNRTCEAGYPATIGADHMVSWESSKVCRWKGWMPPPLP